MTPLDTVEVAADVVAAFVSNNPVPRGELPALIQSRKGPAGGGRVRRRRADR